MKSKVAIKALEDGVIDGGDVVLVDKLEWLLENKPETPEDAFDLLFEQYSKIISQNTTNPTITER